MTLLARIRNLFATPAPLPAGLHHRAVQRPDGAPGRVHLRLHNDGSGLLVLNAATVLHLNRTAAEYALHFVRGSTPDEAAAAIASRYRIGRQQARADYLDFLERIETLLAREDLDPVSRLDFERIEPGQADLPAPLRLDCALTYRLPPETPPTLAPQRRVSRELSTEEWKTALETAWAFGIPHVTFTGGEPTLRPDLNELIAFAEGLGQVTGLLTDGLHLRDGAYLEALLQSGLDHLLILLQPDLPACWQAIETVTPKDIFTSVHLTLTPQTAVQAPEHIRRLAAMGVNAVSLSATSPELDAALNAARETLAEQGLALTWDLPVPYSAINPIALETEAPPGCACLYVEPDGDVLPAQGMAEHILGNLLTTDWPALWQKAREVNQ